MRLEFLCLDENSIKSFNNLFCLQRLRHLYIRYNKISDYTEIDGLQSISTLTELDLSNNPLSRKYGYRFILLQKMSNLSTLDGQVKFIQSSHSRKKKKRNSILSCRGIFNRNSNQAIRLVFGFRIRRFQLSNNL